jgi:ADP-heptose:LPS heptosyltransferase
MKKNENILIIKHGALGDLIQAEGIIKSIRYEHKNAKLVLLTSKKFINLMSMCPYIDDQLIDNRSSFLNIFSLIHLYKNIKKYNFKIIYDLQNSQRTYIYRKYLFKKINWVTTDRKDHPISGLRGLEEMLREYLVISKDIFRPDISWLAIDTKNIIKKNKILSKYIVLLPGSSKKNPLKRWPYFVDLAKLLISKGYEVITILGPEELEMNRSFPGHILKNLDWSQLSGIIKNSYFVVGNDSGPSHIASCLNVKGLALFGPSTSAVRSELKRGKFKILKVDNLADLSANKILEVMVKILNKK